ncbi:uncharacterized protein F4822DRAFT_132775 [Hypoxylon trugodes]|uniref:uncharacterized protein n=1 Tax=Hypoxylon trugodes TaxID=326681 RepID=UPI00218EB42E|nr:uncharacterized protein F4822DRAFT_132775 [Hypoxylon trugodes]KAI1392567.1 hypothetical protein F4822DRAFT_132775 [Hypoxylon trugodes]
MFVVLLPLFFLLARHKSCLRPHFLTITATYVDFRQVMLARLSRYTYFREQRGSEESDAAACTKKKKSVSNPWSF